MSDIDLRKMFPIQCWIRNERGEIVKSPNLLSAIHDAKHGCYALCSYMRTMQGTEIDRGVVYNVANTVTELITGRDIPIVLSSDIENKFYSEHGAWRFWKIFPATEEIYVKHRTSNVIGNLTYKLIDGVVVQDEERHPEDFSIDIAESPLDPRRYLPQCWILDKNGAIIKAESLLSAMRDAYPGDYVLCDYNITYPYEARSIWGDIWHVAKDVRDLITSFLKRNDLSDEELVYHFRDQGIFSYWRVLPTNAELVDNYKNLPPYSKQPTYFVDKRGYAAWSYSSGSTPISLNKASSNGKLNVRARKP